MKDGIPQAYPLIAEDEHGIVFLVIAWEREGEYSTQLRPVLIPLEKTGKHRAARVSMTKTIVQYRLP